MDLRQLRYFLEIAREKSFTRAATRLFVSQPALSKQISDLEKELGAKLFVRRAHSVELTESGAQLKRRAEDIIVLAEQVKTEFRDASSGLTGNIRIGAGESRSIEYLAEACSCFLRLHPQVRIHLTSGNAEQLIARLDQGLLDLALVYMPGNPEFYEGIELPEKETWGILMPEDASLVEKAAITREDLSGIFLITSREGLRLDFRTWYGDGVDRLNVVLDFDLGDNAIRMMRAGVGYLLAFDGLTGLGDGSGIVFRPLDPPLTAQPCLIWRRGRVLGRPCQELLDVFRTVCRKRAPGADGKARD
ncbi:MAG TPA: LysR family transcriptional regulator [Sutterella sp.]|nr:LysR family transcriptional regulator [Sutterella sp.]